VGKDVTSIVRDGSVLLKSAKRVRYVEQMIISGTTVKLIAPEVTLRGRVDRPIYVVASTNIQIPPAILQMKHVVFCLFGDATLSITLPQAIFELEDIRISRLSITKDGTPSLKSLIYWKDIEAMQKWEKMVAKKGLSSPAEGKKLLK
jgi:hypothetical protein